MPHSGPTLPGNKNLKDSVRRFGPIISPNPNPPWTSDGLFKACSNTAAISQRYSYTKLGLFNQLLRK